MLSRQHLAHPVLLQQQARWGRHFLSVTAFTGHYWQTVPFIRAVTHPLQSGQVPASHLSSRTNLKRCFGKSLLQGFSFDRWYHQHRRLMCRSHLCLPCPPLPSLTPVAWVLTDTGMKRDCAWELMNWRTLSETLSKAGGGSQEEKHHPAGAEYPRTKGHETRGPSWQPRAASVEPSSSSSLAPFTVLKGGLFFFPWLVGWLFCFQIT